MRSSQVLTEVDAVILGAAGQTGRPLVRALTSRGASVRAVLHHELQADCVPTASQVCTAELGDLTTLSAVLSGAKVAYYIPPVFDAREELFGNNVIQAALAAQLPRLVYHSVMHSHTQAMPHHWRKAKVEEALRQSSLSWTIVQPAMYSQTPFTFLNAKRTSLNVGFDPAQRFTPVDLQDLAEAVAHLLLDENHSQNTYELAGAQNLSFHDIAAILSQVYGHRVAVKRFPAFMVAAIGARHYGSGAYADLKAMLEYYGANGFRGESQALRQLLGREPTPFFEVASREYSSVTRSTRVSSPTR